MSRRLIYVIVAVAGLTLLLAGILAWRVLPGRIEKAVFTPKEETVDLSALVTRVRELSRLETASMRVVHVSTMTQSYKMVPNALGGDELTLFATGDVIAGVDLSQLTQEDVWRQPDGTVSLRLPPPQILVSRIDNRETRVISRKTGLLRRNDIHMEARARQNAEQGIRNEAVRKGLLPLAANNAEKKLADFLHTMGLKKVTFERGLTQRGE